MKIFSLFLILSCLEACSAGRDKDKIIDSLKLKIQSYETDIAKNEMDISWQKALVESYRQQVVNLTKGQYEKTYVFVIIKFTITTHEYSYDLRMDRPKVQSYINRTPVQEVTNFNEDKKYQLMDELENYIRKTTTYDKFSIIDRQCYSFSTYAEASKNLEAQKTNDQ